MILKIGDQYFNTDHITHAEYTPARNYTADETESGMPETYKASFTITTTDHYGSGEGDVWEQQSYRRMFTDAYADALRRFFDSTAHDVMIMPPVTAPKD